MKNPISINTFLLLLTLLFCIQLLTPQVFSAETMEGSQYRLRLEQVQKDDPTPTRAATLPTPTAVVSKKEAISSSGVSEIWANDNFVQFGPLSPTNPVLRQILFSLDTDSSEMFLYQKADSSLHNGSGQNIPPSTCDTGSCSPTQAAIWNSTLAFGLGVRCDNKERASCADDFVEKNAFRSLGGDTSSVIASFTGSGQAEVSLNYKVNVPGSQPEGLYQTDITYLFLPRL